jgi:hypothetical protein
MKCPDVQDNLAVYTDGRLTREESRTVAGHLEGCPLCRERLAEYREIGVSLRRLERPAIRAGVRADLKRAVVSETRTTRRTWLPFAPDVREFLTMRVLPYGLGAFASIVICGAFLAMMFANLFIKGPATSREPALLAANHHPFVDPGDVSATDFVQSRLGLAGESPSINPQGALVALTRSFVDTGLKGNDEVVVVADVYSDGLAQIAEVVEPSRNGRMVNELERALDSSPGNTPFVPSTMEERPESVRVVLKFQSVDVHAHTRRRAHWQ